MERSLKNYLDVVDSDVAAMVHAEGDVSYEDKFTEYCIEIFEGIGKSEGARVLSYIHPNSRGGIDWKINGYCLADEYKEGSKSYFETLDLYITFFNTERYDYNILKTDYDKTINQIKRFINGALKRHIDYIDRSNKELNELLTIIGKQGAQFDRINIYFLINGFSRHAKEKIKIYENDVYIHTWDMERLYQIYSTNKNREPIEIDLKDYLSSEGIPCIKTPQIDELYECYLAVVPGTLLADLYKEYSSELLESNVRAFLGQAGKFNKGIRDTIREKPHMFLPYNNGITATADNVNIETLSNQTFITKLNDFQIVNGGQTTASLYHTRKKYKDVDLSKIFVQMKLTVIKDEELKNEEVPNIARYANSQNKVSELDLSSNNPFFVRIEEISRRTYVYNPDNPNQSLQWFFERVKGQYRETLNRKTKSQQRIFKTQSPTNKRFVKSDISKFMNLWNLEPHIVARGSQRSFIHYSKVIQEAVTKNKLPGNNYFKTLIGNAIVFKTIDRLFGRKNVDAIGDTSLKSYTVGYTMAYFHFLTNNRIDLWKFYEEQVIDDLLVAKFKELLIFVYSHLIDEASGSLISEYAKRETSWTKLKSIKYNEPLLKTLENYIITEEERDLRELEDKKENNVSLELEDEIFIISEIKKLNRRFWDGLNIYLKSNEIRGIRSEIVEKINRKQSNNRRLTPNEIATGRRVLDHLKKNPDLKEKVENLSSVNNSEVTEVLDLKAIYDRLLSFPDNDWDKSIALGEQASIFDYQELNNIKSVYRSIKNKQRVRNENSLTKAYESLKKLSRFGIKI